jgi:hypothetical protein
VKRVGTGRRLTYSCTPYGPTSAAPSSLSEDITNLRHPSTLESPLFGYKVIPLGEIIRNPDAVGRIAKWSVELMGEMLAYAPRKAIKSQILADFIA